MLRTLALTSLLLLASGCGAVVATNNLLDADIQLEAARTAGADKYAPYEFTSAGLYLHQARLEVGFSNYDVAVEYAQRAAKFASDARDIAVNRTKSETPAGP